MELSVVIPVYGCGGCLRALHARLGAAIAPLTDDYELIFVDDRSPDDAWKALRQLAAEDPAVRALRLSRNFGQHVAITAGLAESTGRWVVVMDCDLQDPPEHIPNLWAKAHEGHEVVLSRRSRRRTSWVRRLAGAAYYRMRNALVKDDMHPNLTNMSLISRKVVDAFLTLRDRDRHYLLIVHWLGFDHETVDVEVGDRHAGRSSYTLPALIRVAIDGMFFQSTVLLRWIVYGGFMMAGLGLLLVAYTIYALVSGHPLPRWTALPMLILVLTGFIIISTGVTALYVGKIFEQVKGRPLYVIDQRLVGGEPRPVTRELHEYAGAAALEPAGRPPEAEPV